MEEAKDVKKRVRDETGEGESDIDSPEVKRLREDLLGSLDDETEFCTSNQALDSFMKSFEDEITASPSATGAGAGGVRVDGLVSESVESRPDFGYLLEASDDELGIPPPPASPAWVENELKNELVRVESDSSEFGSELWDVPSYDSFGFELEDTYNYHGEFAIDGLFDYSDPGFGSGDISWRPETLPAQ